MGTIILFVALENYFDVLFGNPKFICFCFFQIPHTTVDLAKLRLSDSSNSGSEGTVYCDTGSPEMEDYPFLHGQPVMGPFCCATFPLARGLARTIKRL